MVCSLHEFMRNNDPCAKAYRLTVPKLKTLELERHLEAIRAETISTAFVLLFVFVNTFVSM